MVHILLKGRLGNNLFQIATGASLARQNGTSFCVYAPELATDFGISSTYNELMQLKNSILRGVDIRRGLPDPAFLYTETRFAYTPVPYKEGIVLSGYFQSPFYFDEQYVHNLFRIDESTKAYIANKYGDLLRKGLTSIHIRRGDYLSNLDFHPICSISYFRKAIKLVGEEQPFLVVSNDVEWCKKKFRGSNFYFAENETAVVDLYLQSMCINNIISNSSFSWWGAWLNENEGKMVICPAPWFGISARHLDVSTLIPDGWIRLKNRMPLYLSIFACLRKWKRELYRSLVGFGLIRKK